MFDQKLEKLSVECLIINDLLLETANTHYLIDSHLVSPPKIHIFEVKNFEGDFLIEDNRMRLISGKEIKNPLIQLSRTESLFRQLLQQLGYNQKVEAHLVFINPEFYLYGASPDLPIIFPSQLGRFMNQLNSQFFKLAGKHHALAEKLMELHVKDSPFSLLPEYSFDGLTKGILCEGCGELEMFDSGFTTTLTCKKCDFVEDKEAAILRSTEEFSLLFPQMKITSGIIFEWCKIIRSRAVIQRALAKSYQSCSSKKGIYYIKKNK